MQGIPLGLEIDVSASGSVELRHFGRLDGVHKTLFGALQVFYIQSARRLFTRPSPTPYALARPGDEAKPPPYKKAKTYDVAIYYKESGPVVRLAKWERFEHLTLLVIAFNAVWMGIDADSNKSVAIKSAKDVFKVMENFFCWYFTCEVRADREVEQTSLGSKILLQNRCTGHLRFREKWYWSSPQC